MRLRDKVAVVTGAGRGIGEGIAVRFAREGAKVVLAQRTLEDGERVAAAIERDGGKATALSTDVRVPRSVEAMVSTALETYGRLDILCNCAGKGGIEDIVDFSAKHYDAIMDLNVRGILLCMKYAVPHLIASGSGSVINIASITGIVGIPQSIVYCASKGAVLSLTRQAALDLAPSGVRVNAVAPGYIGNQMFYEYRDAHPDPQAVADEVLSSIPMGRLGTNDDVAGAAVYFASDDAQWVTGATLVIDGGTLCR